jgi:3'-phosphoadenosine 5'-phosphosulfate (PAPS) 3'-phosphatase
MLVVTDEDGSDSRAFSAVDPLDGTKAFARRQSHSVGTMVARGEPMLPARS